MLQRFIFTDHPIDVYSRYRVDFLYLRDSHEYLFDDHMCNFLLRKNLGDTVLVYHMIIMALSMYLLRHM